jgi:tRNA pseudouridine55 synthase
MGRNRKGNPVHGWIVLDKPEGMTSTSAVGAVKRLLNAAKAGHGGTLDPFATGILPIALGEATKTVSWAMDGVKQYRFTVRWGVATDTEDRDGQVIAESEVRPDRPSAEAILERFTGEIEQIPPAFSAIKLDGKRAYDLARKGEAPEMPPRMVVIDELRLVEMLDADHAIFDAVCGKGTYIRSLARDIAVALGTVGHLVALRRTRVGPFDEGNAISLDELAENMHVAAACKYLLPVETALDDIPALAVTESEAGRLRNGQEVSLLRKADLDRIADLEGGDTAIAMADGKPVALVRYAAGEIRPVRVLNL